MKEDTRKSLRTGRKIGALVGGIMFAVFGIVPGFYFGSYATIILLSQLTGGPLDPGIMVRILVAVGTMMGLFCTAAVSIVIGSVAGTAMAYVAETMSDALKSKPKTAEAGAEK